MTEKTGSFCGVLCRLSILLSLFSVFNSCRNVPGKDQFGDLVLRENADLLWYNQPSAVYYRGIHSRTYFSFLDGNRNITVQYYDHDDHRFSGIKKINTWRYLDDHGAPVIHVMEHGSYKGHVMVLLDLHNSPLVLKRSVAAEDISTWSAPDTICHGACTYPSLIENSKGELIVFYKRNVFEKGAIRTRAMCYKTSSDGGDSWSAEKILLNFGQNTWIYAVPVVNRGDTVHIAFSVKEAAGSRVVNVYYLKSDDWGQHWQSSDSVLTPPIDTLQAVFNTPHNKETRVWDIQLDQSGQPVICFEEYEYVHNRGTAFWARKGANGWQIVPVDTSGNVYYPGGIVMDPKNPEQVYTTIDLENKKSGIAEFEYDSLYATFRKKMNISKDTLLDQAWPQMVGNYSDLKLIWVEVKNYKMYQDFSCNIKGLFDQN